jgi:hypothetical protein
LAWGPAPGRTPLPTTPLGRKYEGPGRDRSSDRGGGRARPEIVTGMVDVIWAALGVAGWMGGVLVLVVMALLPLFEQVEGRRRPSGARR